MQPSAKLAYTPERSSIAVRVVGCAAFVGVALWVASLSFGAERSQPIQAITVLVCGGYFAFMGAAFLRQLIEPVGLIADHTGFSFRRSWKRLHFRWDEVSEFKVVTYRSLRVIGFDVTTDRQSATAGANRSAMGVSDYIFAHSFSAPAILVCEALNELRRQSLTAA